MYFPCFCWLWEGDQLSYLSIIESHFDQFPALLRLTPQDNCVIDFVFLSLLILFLFSIGSEKVVQWALVMATFQPKKSIVSSCPPHLFLASLDFCAFPMPFHPVSGCCFTPPSECHICLVSQVSSSTLHQFIHSSIHSFFHCIKLTIMAFIIYAPPYTF